MNTIVAMTNIIGRAHTIKNAEKRMSKILFWYLNETTGNQFYITIQLEKLIKDQGLTHFSTLDHRANARNVNMNLKPETVVVLASF